MKFAVLALDYDGTIATEGVLDSDVKAAIKEARANGIVVVIVTGRILSELIEVAGNLDFVDAVVAENGAVLALANGQPRLTGQAPTQSFLDELKRRKIDFKLGQRIVEANADTASAVLDAIRTLELPLAILFNQGRLMVLPQSVSKGTGLRRALNSLRLSGHNAIGIGNAENDHDLLAECEIGVAVSWGSPRLQAEADEVIHGDGPKMVASYIRQAMQRPRLPPCRTSRHQITLGTAQDGSPVAAAAHGRNVLIVGEPLSGKSFVAGLTCEEMILQGYSVCVVDPEGDYSELESLPGVVVLGHERRPPDLPDVDRALRHFDMSVVIDLSQVGLGEKIEYLKVLLPMLASLRRRTGLPHQIVLDEAHYFLHEPDIRKLLDMELGAYVIVTYRPSDLHPDVRSAVEVVIAKRLTDAHEVRTLQAMAQDKKVEATAISMLSSLLTNEAVIAAQETHGSLLRFTLENRLTSHVRHRGKYLDVEVESGHEFVFTEHGTPVAQPARSLRQFASALCEIPSSVADDHARRGDLSRWIAGVFYDHRLASDIQNLEQDSRTGRIGDVRGAIASLVLDRYGSPA